jgi:hypothetical protein
MSAQGLKAAHGKEDGQMAEDLYQMLQISPEADAVRQLLQPREQPARQFYSSPQAQSLSDYHSRIEQDIGARDALAQDAEILRRINLPTRGGEQARALDWQKALEKAAYEKQTSALMDDLRKLDPADPEHQTQQDEIIAKHPISRTALSDPRISGIVKRQSHDYEEMQSLFDKDSVSRQEYANLRVSGLDPDKARQQVRTNAQKRADRLWFATNGGNPEDFDSGKFNLPDGTPDKAKMAYYLAQSKAGAGPAQPWQRRLSQDEREAVRKRVARAREDAPADFTAEFAAVKDKNPSITEDEYVKQFKNAPDFATYKARRLPETAAPVIGELVRDYGLTEDEARSAIGLNNVDRGTSSTTITPDEAGQKALSGVSEQPSTGAANVSGVSPLVSTGMAGSKQGSTEASAKVQQAVTNDGGGTQEGQRSQLRQGVSDAGQANQASVSGVRQSGQSDAPPGLQSTPSGGVVLPNASSGTSRVDQAGSEILSIAERDMPKAMTPQEELANRAKTKEIFNRHWTAAKGDLQKTLQAKKGSKLADDPAMLKSLLRSVQINEAVRPEQVSLPARQDKLGGAVFENPVDLLAKFLGKDPDAVAEVELEAGGKKYPLVDFPGGQHTWRDVIKAWADEQVPQGSAQAVAGKSDFSNLWGGK